MPRQGRQERFLQRQRETAEVCGVLRFRINTDWPLTLMAEALGEIDYLVEGWNLEAAVVFMRADREPLARAQRLDLGDREVFGEPAGHRHPVDRLGPLAIG